MAEGFIEFTTGLEEEELPEINKMPEDWDTYVTLLDDEKALIMVDLEVAKVCVCFGFLTLVVTIMLPLSINKLTMSIASLSKPPPLSLKSSTNFFMPLFFYCVKAVFTSLAAFSVNWSNLT